MNPWLRMKQPGRTRDRLMSASRGKHFKSETAVQPLESPLYQLTSSILHTNLVSSSDWVDKSRACLGVQWNRGRRHGMGR